MKSAVFYASPTKLTKSHKPVHHRRKGCNFIPNGATPQPEYFVRMEVVKLDIDTALLKARPYPGETVLNSIPL